MKKIVAILISVAMLAAFAVFVHAEAAVQFEVGSVSVDTGASTATVPIYLTANSGHAGADITIVSDLTITDIEEIKVSAVYNVTKGLVNWSYSTNRTMVGEILRVTFALPENIQPGDFWDVGLNVTMLRDANMTILTSEVKSGKITVKGLSGLTIATAPTKLTYTVGESIDTTGLSLTATYVDGTTGVITSGFTCSPETLSTVGMQVITVSYGGFTASFDVEVSAGTTERLAGDANMDGTVGLKDVVQIRRWIVGGWGAVINESNADVDGNNKVNLKDAVLIRRYLADDWDVTLV